MPNRVFVSLGSNIEKEFNLPAAVRCLSRKCRILRASKVYESIPAGTIRQPNFLNAAVLLETDLDVERLKGEVLTEVETELERKRSTDKFGPRTIDVDIVLFNEEVFDFGGRHIPDSDLLTFAHVAVPVAELAPDMPHPETGEPLAEIARRLHTTMKDDPGHSSSLWERPDVVLRY